MVRKEAVKSKFADLVAVASADVPASVITTLWTPTPRLGGNMNLSGVKLDVAPAVEVAVALPVDRSIAGSKALKAVPLIVIAEVAIVDEMLKSTRSTVIVEPGFVVVALGVAPAFCTKAVLLTLLCPALSVIQTYPPNLVPELRRIVPVKTPSASIVPEPLNATPPAPVVGAVTVASFCGFKRILQSAQVALKPPPVTVTVAPRAAVVGVNFENAVIAVNVDVMAVPSKEDFTVNVPVVLEAV